MKNYTNSILASLYADSLALPAHWIYDQNRIKNEFGKFDKLYSPENNPYHNNKPLGGHTHYGDQAVLIAKYAKNGDFNLEEFKTAWFEFFKNYSGYIDNASRTTIKNYQEGIKAGSTSTDLGGASRVVGLLSLTQEHSLEEIINITREITAFTHNNQITIDTAEFLVRVSYQLLSQDSEIEKVIEANLFTDFLKESFSKAKQNQDLNPLDAATLFGPACDITGALPLSFYLILKYKKDLLEALNQNCLSGGDSAARGLMIGMILGSKIELTADISHVRSFLELN